MKLDVGKVYVVSSQDGCSLCMPDGTQMMYVPAGKACLFVPQTAETVVFGEAVITRTRGAEMLLETLMSKLPKWFAPLKAELAALLDGTQFEVYWQASQNKLIVHTDRVADDLLEQVRTTAEAYLPAGVELVQYNHHIEVSWRDINKYAECTNVPDMLAVNPDYKNDLTSDGEWAYPLPRLQSGKNAFGSSAITKFAEDLPSLTDGWDMFNRSKIRDIRSKMPELIQGTYFCVYAKKLENCIVEMPKLQQGTNMFDRAILNKQSALCILNTIPSYSSGSTHKLTIGIHIDHQNDEEVLAAIANAEAKGWTLTVQWNGTATAAASVMRFGQLIYAKVDEIEMPDGTTERVLDWGHYVTNEEGYETFRSLESAYEYFGLPMPEEESQPTE